MRTSLRLLQSALGGIRQRWEAFIPPLAYLMLSWLMTWPVAAHLSTRLIGRGPDVWAYQWAFWWVKHALAQGHNLLYTDLLFHPVGVSLIYYNMAWLNIAIWLPLQAIFGGIAAYNLIFIAIFASNGFAMYLLAREVTGSRPAAFVAGLIYGFWPYMISYADSPNMVFTCWIPLALLYVRRALLEGKVRDGLLAAMFLFLTGLTLWHLLIMGGIAIGLYVLLKLASDGRCRTRRALGLMVMIGLLAAVALAPVAVPAVIAQTSRDHPEDLFLEEEDRTQTDLLAYFVPSRHNILWGQMVSQLYNYFAINQILVASLGCTTLALATYGTVRHWREARLWLVVALISFLLALGPLLRVAGHVYPAIPMPYRLVGDLFFIKALRRPDRFNLILSLPLAMLAAFGVRALLRRPSFSRRSLLVTGALGALILLEYCPVPYPTVDPRTPAWFGQLAQEPGDFAILDLPTHSHIYDKRYMFYQITHGRPLVEGHVARLPREALTFINRVPFLSYAREHLALDPALTDVSHELNQLAEANVRYVILHKEPMGPDQLAGWRDWLTIQPSYEDDDLVVYRTDPRLGRDFEVTHVFADGIGSIEATATPSETTQAGLIEVYARWGSASAPGRDYDACVSLMSPEGHVAQSHCEPLSPDWPPSQWPANAVVRGTYALQVDPFAQPETYTLTLGLVQSNSKAPAGWPLALGSVRVNALPRVFAEPTPQRSVWARWDEQIVLRGYDFQRDEDTLDLTLYWQAQQRMKASYKVFVHVIDPADGTIVTQADAVPRQWTYPTTWWERGEIVSDTIRLSADGLGGREFRLIVGLTDLETGSRLPVYGPEGQRYADDAFPLTWLGE